MSSKANWDESAELYAELAPKISFYRRSSEEIVTAARLESGMTVLDLGCGSSGLTIIEMLQKVPALKIIYAVDASPKMVEVASQRVYAEAQRADIDARKVRFIDSPAEHVDRRLPLHGVNRIICNSAFWMFQTAEALTAIHQVLAEEDGLLVFNLAEWDYVFNGTPVRQPRYEAIDRELAQLNLPPKLHRGSEHKFTRQEIEDLFTKRGFTLQEPQEFVVSVSAHDWARFYQIPTIIRKSLPQLPFTEARKVLQAAMKGLEDQDPTDIRWITFTAVPTAITPQKAVAAAQTGYGQRR